MQSPDEGKTKFDALKLISRAIGYAQHLRLMILMGALGLTAGVVYFLFSTPTYSATSLITVQEFGAPVRDREIRETSQTVIFSRTFIRQFSSTRVQLEAARHMGLVEKGATQEELLEVVPSVVVVPIDWRHIELVVLAYDPHVVRNFAQEMVDAFLRIQQQGWEEYRDESLTRYAEQVEQLDSKIAETIESLSQVEREQNLTEATLEQKSLLEIPKQLIQTKERLARMNGVRDLVERLESEAAPVGTPPLAGPENIMALLSLLGSFEKETEVVVGNVISTPIGPRRPVNVKNPNSGPVVVQPGHVESIEPWREVEKTKRRLESEIAEASKTYLPDHPVMKDLNSELEETERALAAELKLLRDKFDLEYARLQQKQEQLEARMPEYHAVTEQVGKSAYAYAEIAETQQMWDQARKRLAEKLAVVAFSEDFNWLQLRFKEHLKMRDEVPVSPNKTKLAFLSLLIGLAGALGLPTLLNVFDTTAKNVQELENTTGLVGIGIVPLTTREFLEEIHRAPAQGASLPNYLLECFRVIRSNIILHPNHRNRSQVVLVTSSRPQEGKTTQAANLAWAFHSMGEKTLLIDCDLRRGRVHELVKLNKNPGLTRLLLGEITPEDAIMSAGAGGFHVLPRGPVIAGTTEILCQKPFENLIEGFREQYDRIILDTPPVLGLSESSSLQRIVDGTVLVVRSEKTSRKDVLDAITLLRKSTAHFFGFVLNAVDLSKANNYFDYYYYSAPYYDQFEPEEEPQEPKGRRKTVHQPSIGSPPSDAEIHELLRKP